MTPSAEALLRRLREARASGRLLETPPPEQRPQTLDDAYATAAALIAGEAVTGWKIGATSERAQAFLSLQAPFWGAVLQGALLPSPAELESEGAPFEVEPEIVFRLGRDIADAEPHARAAVSAACFGMEVNRPSFAEPFAAGALCLIADNGVNRALVVGAEIEGWRERDLAAIELSLAADGQNVRGTARGSGFDPWEALAWLAAAKRAAGQPLRAGDYVATGSIGGSLKIGSSPTGDTVGEVAGPEEGLTEGARDKHGAWVAPPPSAALRPLPPPPSSAGRGRSLDEALLSAGGQIVASLLIRR